MPMVRDPKTGNASVSLTLVFLSFNLWLISILDTWAQVFGGIDVNQTFNMVIVCFGLYYGRKLSFGKGKYELGDSDEKLSKKEVSKRLDHDDGSEAEIEREEDASKDCTCERKGPNKKRT